MRPRFGEYFELRDTRREIEGVGQFLISDWKQPGGGVPSVSLVANRNPCQAGRDNNTLMERRSAQQASKQATTFGWDRDREGVVS